MSGRDSLDLQRRLEELILDTALEDQLGLYEILQHLQDPRWEVRDQERLRLAKQVVRHMLRRGVVRMFRAGWATDLFEPVPEQEVEGLLEDPNSWKVDKVYLAIYAGPPDQPIDP